MKKIVILIFVLLFSCFIKYANADHPIEPASPEQKESEAGKALPSSLKPAGSEQLGEIFFASGTVSSDGKYLYVIFDRFLLQYVLPTLDLKRKADLGIAVAPVTPSISISKDSKSIYVISNGILYKIDAATFKIKKRTKITP
jgi:hypothetical protein